MMLWCGPRFLGACQRRYGQAFTLRVASMGTLVYLADPADIKTVFAGDPRIYHAGEANSMLKGLLGDTSVLVIDDDMHRDRRRLMLAPVARDAIVRQAPLIGEIAAKNIASWPVGATFAVAPRMSQITLEVILRTVIGASDPRTACRAAGDDAAAAQRRTVGNVGNREPEVDGSAPLAGVA